MIIIIIETGARFVYDLVAATDSVVLWLATDQPQAVVGHLLPLRPHVAI